MDRFLQFNTAWFAAGWFRAVLPLHSMALRRLIERALATLREWRLRSRSRRELSDFDEHQLKDIGLTAAQASFERGKSFLRP